MSDTPPDTTGRTRVGIRRAALIAAAIVAVLVVAVVAILIGRGMGARDSAGPAPTPSSGTEAPGAPGGKRAAADSINRCGERLAAGVRHATDLELTVQFPNTASASAARITGTVTLSNIGTTRVTGTTAPTPAITLSQDGVVLWHSNGPVSAMAAVVDLAAGASMTYPASFSPLHCTSRDEDAAHGFPDSLPAVGTGSYALSAAIDLGRTDAGGTFTSNDLVVGPLAAITLN